MSTCFGMFCVVVSIFMFFVVLSNSGYSMFWAYLDVILFIISGISFIFQILCILKNKFKSK
jgi:hypothetical protein